MRCPSAILQAILAGAILTAIPACHRESKEGAKRQKKDAQAQAAQTERAALLKFANSAREVLEWQARQENPGSEAAQRRFLTELSAKLQAIPVKNVPADVGEAWAKLLPAFRALAETPSLNSNLREQGAQAAIQLNRALEAHGIIGLHF